MDKILTLTNNSGLGGYDMHIREQRGNHLAALIEEWLNSGNLFGKEKYFLDVLKIAGLDNVTHRDPNYREEAVYAVFMNLRNPLDTSNITDSVFKALRRSAIAAERHFDPMNAYDSDAWDKLTLKLTAETLLPLFAALWTLYRKLYMTLTLNLNARFCSSNVSEKFLLRFFSARISIHFLWIYFYKLVFFMDVG